MYDVHMGITIKNKIKTQNTVEAAGEDFCLTLILSLLPYYIL